MKWEIHGDKELIKRLNEIGPSLRKRVLRPAVTAAARPIRKAVKANVPKKTKELGKSIDIKTVSLKTTAIAGVGPRADKEYMGTDLFGRPQRMKPVRYAHLVNNGIKPHAIKTKKTGRLIFDHPGTQGSQFMQKAFNSQASTAMQILSDKIQKGLQEVA